MSTQELQNIIAEWEKGNEQPFQKLFRKLYTKTLPSIKKLTKSSTAAEEVFMEGIHTFLEHFFIAKKTPPQNTFSYFYMICRNVWFDNHIKQKHPHLYNDQLEIADEEGLLKTSDDNTSHLKKVAWARAIEQLKGLCKKIFQLHIEEGRRLKSLWQELDFNNYQSLVQANYRCKKKLTQAVLEEYETLMGN